MASTLSGLVLCLLVATVVANEYVYEFGDKSGGTSSIEKSGVIPLFQYSTYVPLNVPIGVRVSYVKVIVNGLQPPKVTFDFDSNTVSIQYSYLESTLSTYKINAKTKPIYNSYDG